MDLVPVPDLEQVAKRFRLLSDPVRLQLLNHLHAEREMHVQALVEVTGQSHANVSKHLRTMAAEGMVARRAEGRRAYYSISDPTLASLCLLMCSRLQHERLVTENESASAS